MVREHFGLAVAKSADVDASDIVVHDASDLNLDRGRLTRRNPMRLTQPWFHRADTGIRGAASSKRRSHTLWPRPPEVGADPDPTDSAMPLTPCPDRGAVITYLNPDVLHPVAVLSGVVLGPHVVDPETSHLWVPVLLPDGTTSVLDTANIMQVEPPESSCGDRETAG